MKRNYVHLISVLLLAPMFCPVAAAICHKFPLDSALEIAGIIGAAIGTIWLAAGVYISKRELGGLTAGSNKITKANIKGAIATASHHVNLGVAYTVLGAGTLVFGVLNSVYKWL